MAGIFFFIGPHCNNTFPHPFPAEFFFPLLQQTLPTPIAAAPLTLDSPLLTRGFSFLAGRLHAEGEDVTLIVIGGVLNAMHFESRQFTGDVDFLSTLLNPAQTAVIDEVKRVVRRTIGDGRIPRCWLNDDAVFHTSSPGVMAIVAREAREQNTRSFREPGLKILAAPWSFCLCTKLVRIGTPNQKPYDVADTVDYLRANDRRHQYNPVEKYVVEQWAAQYRLQGVTVS